MQAAVSQESAKPQPTTTGGITGEHLSQLVERIERLEEEKADLGQDIRDIYTEAKGHGFDAKVIRQIIKIRKMDQNEMDEQEALLHLYMQAIGMRPTQAH
ncbi:MAG: DUF2312 domain-containing protein [Magnetococcales bacterium]|nr:DUF2312 domain-containing protein [Magnetococcales bacterium]